MKKKVTIIVIILFLLIDAVIVGFVINKLYFKPQKAHFHAGFQVYADGKLLDFSDEKYMNTTPCALRDHSNKTETPEDLQMDKAHLHDNIGNVAHAHVKGGKWKDLFQNMKFEISSKGIVKGYVNGEPIDNILNYDIKPFDSVIFLVGDKNKGIDAYLLNAVKKDEIVKAEKMSETCGSGM